MNTSSTTMNKGNSHSAYSHTKLDDDGTTGVKTRSALEIENEHYSSSTRIYKKQFALSILTKT